jgi:hypothetical protein
MSTKQIQKCQYVGAGFVIDRPVYAKAVYE